jgi:hypothetical protein
MIGTRKMPAPAMPENNTFEKTDPWTKDFFDPQKSAVI